MNRIISDIFQDGQHRTFIVAEIGSNHCGDLQLAKESIDAAEQAGVDAVKFQSINLGELYIDPAPNMTALHRKIDMEEIWHARLKEYCDKANVIFFSSPTYMRAVDLLEDIGVDLYKLASAQVGVFPQLVEKVAKLGKPTLLSTGLLTYGDLGRVVRTFRKCENEQFIILHCNSIYPTPPEKVCLDRMAIYSNMFGCPVGFSDHTQGNAVTIAAVARGAKVIEKHFTLSKNFDTPDASFSSEPREFESLVKGVRVVESACTPIGPRLEIEPEEQFFKNAILYRLVLARSKEKNDSFDFSDFEYKRHSDGVDCVNESLVVSQMRAARPINAGKILDWKMLKGK